MSPVSGSRHPPRAARAESAVRCWEGAGTAGTAMPAKRCNQAWQSLTAQQSIAPSVGEWCRAAARAGAGHGVAAHDCAAVCDCTDWRPFTAPTAVLDWRDCTPSQLSSSSGSISLRNPAAGELITVVSISSPPLRLNHCVRHYPLPVQQSKQSMQSMTALPLLLSSTSTHPPEGKWMPTPQVTAMTSLTVLTGLTAMTAVTVLQSKHAP